MTTIANIQTSESAHWYTKSGDPVYTVTAKGTGLQRPTTLRDAKEMGLLPSVTGILKILNRPALNAWKTEQCILAALTTPRLEGESIDEFVHRVLHDEKIQDQESQIARDRGTEIHEAMELLANGKKPGAEILSWVDPAWGAIEEYGRTYETESILVGNGYAGRTDLIQEAINAKDALILWDFKSTKKLPKSESWPEHQLQLSAYCTALCRDLPVTEILAKNCYISTVDCGAFAIFDVPNWAETYNEGFAPLVRHWQWANQYFV